MDNDGEQGVENLVNKMVSHEVIEKVVPGSIADRLGIKAGDLLLSINGQPVTDQIDYRFLGAGEWVQVDIKSNKGYRRSFTVKKDFETDLGLVLSSANPKNIRECRNKCIFCFVDQMPGGMRESLYVRDDDYRQSFLYGNFITLTNTSLADLERIVRLRLSPLYISVHTTNPELRCRMLRNKDAGRLMEQMKFLAEGGIEMHTQIVLCPGVNDGPELDRTIQDLASLWPAVNSLAVVPVGLTRYRHGLMQVDGFDHRLATELVRQLKKHQLRFLHQLSTRFVFPADEFYLLAEMNLPAGTTYEGYPQLENGVGLVRLFLDNYRSARRRLPDQLPARRRVLVVTGISAGPLLQSICSDLVERVGNLEIMVAPIQNDFFGPRVTVAGLLTGGDLVRGLLSHVEGKKWDAILLPSIMLKTGEDLFLDNLSLKEVAFSLDTPLTVVNPDGRSFVKAILGNPTPKKA